MLSAAQRGRCCVQDDEPWYCARCLVEQRLMKKEGRTWESKHDLLRREKEKKQNAAARQEQRAAAGENERPRPTRSSGQHGEEGEGSAEDEARRAERKRLRKLRKRAEAEAEAKAKAKATQSAPTPQRSTYAAHSPSCAVARMDTQPDIDDLKPHMHMRTP